MLTGHFSAGQLATLKQQHPQIFLQQKRYIKWVSIIVVGIFLYYLFFFKTFGIPWQTFVNGSQQISRYFLRMFVWHDFVNWPFRYYFGQIFITLAIVFAGTITATLIALPLSFLAARNVMSTTSLRLISFVVRRFLDIFRGIDMAIWGLIFVRAVGMGPLAGVLAIIMQDMGLFVFFFFVFYLVVDKSPNRGLTAMGANALQKQRFGIFTQSFPTFLALSLYQIESNTRSAAVLGFVGAGGIGLVYAENMRLWNWDVVMFITLIMVVIVMIMDKISATLRKKYIVGEEIALYQPTNNIKSKV